MTTKDLIHKFIEENKTGEKNIEFANRIIRTNYPLYAVPTKKVEAYAKELVRSGAKFQDFPLDSHDAICLAGFALASMKISPEEKVQHLDTLIKHFDTWATVDCITCRMKKMESEEEYFISLLKRKNPFEKRVGMIWLMRFKLKESPRLYLPLILSAYDEDYYVKMAKAWSIAECALANFDYAKSVISSTQDEFVRRKAISKCCDSFRINAYQKDELRKLRK